MKWYLKVLKNYFVFSGRSTRKEYWMFVLINTIIAVVLSVIDSALFGEVAWISSLYMLGILLPGLAVGVRRLHDTGRNGWWILICLIPILGGLVFLFFTIQDSYEGENQYGANPKCVVV